MNDDADHALAERAAFLIASETSMDATLDAHGTTARHPDNHDAALAAVRRMVDAQVEALAAYDRFARAAGDLDPADRENLRAGRVDLAIHLQATHVELQRLTALAAGLG